MKKPTRKERIQMRRRKRAATYAVVSALVLGAAGYLLVRAFWKPDLPAMASNVIDISADMGGSAGKKFA